MTHAFSELYIENAQRVFAQMTHYVIHDLKMEYDPFFRLFVQSGVAAQFEKGNPRYVAGMSGTELADEVMRRVTGYGCAIESEPYYDRTEAYWTGFKIPRNGSYAFRRRDQKASQALCLQKQARPQEQAGTGRTQPA